MSLALPCTLGLRDSVALLQGRVSLLRDVEERVEHGQVVIDGTTSRDVLDLLVDGHEDVLELSAVVDDMPPVFLDPPMQ